MAGLLSIDDLVTLKKQGVAEVPRVELFGSGLHREGEQPYTRADMETIVRNFQALSTGPDPMLPVPVVIGHEDDQSWLADTGLPAAGRVAAVWQEPAGLLCCKFSDLPQTIADAVTHRLYFSVSAEIDPEPPFGCPGNGLTLRGVALLGGQAPQLKWLSKNLQVKAYAEWLNRLASPRRFRVVSRAKGGCRFYSEATTMDRKALEDQLRQLGWTDEMIAALASVKDPDFQTFVMAAMAQAAGTAQPAAAGGAGTSGNADMPPRDQMVQEIIAADPSQDQATLEAMPDADLFALWQQLVGGTQMSEGAARPAGTPPTPKPPTPRPPAPGPVPAPGTPVTPTTPPGVADAATMASYAEATRLMHRVAAQNRAVLAAGEKRLYAEKASTTAAHCRRWIDKNRILPRDADANAALPNLYSQLMDAPVVGTRKYGEKVMTPYEAIVASIDSRPENFAKRHYSEQVPDPIGGSGLNDVAAQAKKYAEERNKHVQRRAG